MCVTNGPGGRRGAFMEHSGAKRKRKSYSERERALPPSRWCLCYVSYFFLAVLAAGFVAFLATLAAGIAAFLTV